MTKAGKLRHRVSIKSAVTASDGQGGHTISSWSTVVDTWCNIETMSAYYQFAYHQSMPGLTHKVTMRYYPGIAPKMRLIHDNVIYSIEGVQDKDNRKKELELFCRQEPIGVAP